MTLLASLPSEVRGCATFACEGTITSVRGPMLYARIPNTAIGDLCIVKRRDGSEISTQVISFAADEVCLAPFDDLEGVAPGARAFSSGRPLTFSINDSVIGQVVDSFGRSLTGKGFPGVELSFRNVSPSPIERPRITEVLETGVAVIDGLCTLGVGQRIGLFAAPGVGKTTLLGMISRHADVDLSVIALIGERGREVVEFLDDALGPEGMRKAVAVVSTSEETPIRRALAIETATSIAEYFRSRGKRVLLLVDSLTRAARALREVSLAAGELPIRQGFTPTVYSKLPQFLERAGMSREGSITAIYTVLTNGEGEVDPLGDEIRSLLDGHLVLDSKVAASGVRPAIDPTLSISRLMHRLKKADTLRTAETIRIILSRLKRDKDVLLFGGAPDKELSAALAVESELKAILSQHSAENRNFPATEHALRKVAERFSALANQA